MCQVRLPRGDIISERSGKPILITGSHRSGSTWLVRNHEVLSTSPVAELRRLCKALGLEWTRTVEDDVVKYTRSDNPVTAPEGTVRQIRRDSAAIVSRWKEILTKEEIAGDYGITHPVCGRLYTDEDWGEFSR